MELFPAINCVVVVFPSRTQLKNDAVAQKILRKYWEYIVVYFFTLNSFIAKFTLKN